MTRDPALQAKPSMSPDYVLRLLIIISFKILRNSGAHYKYVIF